MDESRLSDMYGKATSRLQQAGSELYESLHTDDGRPVSDINQVIEYLSTYKRWLLVEVDFIRELVREYGEQNGGKSE